MRVAGRRNGPIIRTIALSIIAVAGTVAVAPFALADEPTSFSTCASHGRLGRVCEGTYFALETERVWVRGKVRPVHAAETAVVLRQRPGSTIWRRVTIVPISDHGKMRFRLKLTVDDVHASKPHRVKFKILGHGASDGVRIYVARSRAGSAVQAAHSVLGTPYKRNSSYPQYGGLDCSGLTEWSWEQAGVEIPGGAYQQYTHLRRIGLRYVRPGDLVYYGGSGPHIAIAIGDRKIIHVTGSGYQGRTRIDSMYGYAKPWGAVRVA